MPIDAFSLRRLLTMYCKQWFSDPTDLQFHYPEGIDIPKWNSEKYDEIGGIDIYPEGTQTRQSCNTIIITVGDQQIASEVSQPSLAGATITQLLNIKAPIVFRVYGLSYDDTIIIAETLKTRLTGLGWVLVNCNKMRKFNLTQIQKPKFSKNNGNVQSYVSVLVVEASWSETYQVTLETHLLKNITLATTETN